MYKYISYCTCTAEIIYNDVGDHKPRESPANGQPVQRSFVQRLRVDIR